MQDIHLFNIVVVEGSYKYHIKNAYKIWLENDILAVYSTEQINGRYYVEFDMKLVSSIITIGDDWQWGDRATYIITSRDYHYGD